MNMPILWTLLLGTNADDRATVKGGTAPRAATSEPRRPPLDPQRPYELPDDAVTVDSNGRIVVTLRSRSGRVVGCYAIAQGRAAVVARDCLGRHSAPEYRDSEPATSQHPTTLPPPPEMPLDARGGWAVPAWPTVPRAPSRASVTRVIVAVGLALLAAVVVAKCEPLRFPLPEPEPAMVSP